MRVLVCLLLMLGTAQAQELFKTAPGSISVQGKSTSATFIMQNVSGKPLSVAALVDGTASIGGCTIYPLFQFHISGLTAGYRNTEFVFASNTTQLEKAFQTISPGQRISVTLRSECPPLNEKMVNVTVPLVINDAGKQFPYALTAFDVPVR